jgi:hypothetical protein
VNEQITVTLALTVTVDPNAWYTEHGADPGIDIPDQMLTHLRQLPSLNALDGKVRLMGLSRRGRHCRQAAQHRAVESSPFRFPMSPRTPTPANVRDLIRRGHAVLSSAGHVLRNLSLVVGSLDSRIPNEPSGNFL